mmetsp:Transcript_62330/g.197418  ORF Transcript_62330/g.197418 Transcript_62330/m.197418 type:complete len:213 (+) Transcript_62330:712-1350(+)
MLPLACASSPPSSPLPLSRSSPDSSISSSLAWKPHAPHSAPCELGSTGPASRPCPMSMLITWESTAIASSLPSLTTLIVLAPRLGQRGEAEVGGAGPARSEHPLEHAQPPVAPHLGARLGVLRGAPRQHTERVQLRGLARLRDESQHDGDPVPVHEGPPVVDGLAAVVLRRELPCAPLALLAPLLDVIEAAAQRREELRTQCEAILAQRPPQ